MTFKPVAPGRTRVFFHKGDFSIQTRAKTLPEFLEDLNEVVPSPLGRGLGDFDTLNFWEMIMKVAFKLQGYKADEVTTSTIYEMGHRLSDSDIELGVAAGKLCPDDAY